MRYAPSSVDVRRGSTFRNPLYYLRAYGLQNPTVQWLIEKGHLQPGMCQDCRAEGFQRGRYGEVLWQRVDGVPVKIPCRTCAGLKLALDRKPHEADFVDQASLDIARRIGIEVTPHSHRCPLAIGDRWRDPSLCECVLR